jgi:VanZ family protein
MPVLLWMMLIFGFSTGAGSTKHTSRIIGPILRWLIPGIADTTVNRVQTVVRKGGHVSEYAALAWLLWRARRQPVKNDPRPWRGSEAAFAFVLALLFAASDEVHQAFVPGREARVGDVCFDATGAALGLLALHLWGRWRGKW